ncbi:MAG: YbhB/YbcL family Raf kinase inhibitor-like protein [Betaproteobacteria bacterium]|nr:YbhB/YbcL family Raf kinase inhibitor-like protein [Betaproteobacteria bacterium]
MSYQPIRKFVFSCLILGLGLCALPVQAQVILSSPAFVEGGTIPNEFVCTDHYGKNWSPPLNVSGVPRSAESLALVLRDTSADGFLHWMAWNIDPATTSLPYNISQSAPFEQGTNDSGGRGYFGPCPPCTAQSCGAHIYEFRLYALNTRFDAEPSQADLEGAATAMASLRGSRSVFDSATWLPVSDDLQVSSIVNGPIERQVISAQFVPKDQDIGAQIAIFIAANVVGDEDQPSQWMILDSNHQWAPFTSCDKATPARSGRFLADPVVIPVVGAATDLRPVLNTALFVGYGLGTDSVVACEEMLGEGRFKQIYTVR